MKLHLKIVIQILISVVLFFGVYFSLRKIPFTKKFDIQKFTNENEKKLGDLILDTIILENEEINNDSLKIILDEILLRICNSNGIESSEINLIVIEKSEVNAFTLPGDNIIVNTGLIMNTRSVDEFSGVLAHELAHIQLDHVMKKLAREVGLHILFSVVGGSGGGEAMREIANVTSSSAFEREQERDADSYAVQILVNSSVDPNGLAEFLERLSGDQLPVEILGWINTHPNNDERASNIRAKSLEYYTKFEPIYTGDWMEVRSMAGYEKTTDFNR